MKKKGLSIEGFIPVTPATYNLLQNGGPVAIPHAVYDMYANGGMYWDGKQYRKSTGSNDQQDKWLYNYKIN